MKNVVTPSESAPPVASAGEIEIFDAEGALSRDFLLQRGFCCENGCKNCPYGFGPRRKKGKA